jgi:hypothetical protein
VGKTRFLVVVAISLAGVADAALVQVAEARVGDDVPSSAACAAEESSADGLNDVFESDLGSLAGMDYQRAFDLDDGRTLWVFQDVFVRTPNGAELVHNAGAVQDGMCFHELLSGNASAPWIASEDTDRFHRWFWPLGGHQRSPNSFVLYLAEMEERGHHYLANATPVATWTAVIDLDSLAASELVPAPDPSAALYGWDVVTDDQFVYLFAHCYRQFGFGFLGHDGCAREVKVARQRRGLPSRPLQYWDGVRWGGDSDRAANIAPSVGPDGEDRAVNPMQFRHDAGQWIAVTKVGDWWGHSIYLDAAPAPTGPWTTAAVVPIEPLGESSEFNTYFASFVSTPASPSSAVDRNARASLRGQPAGSSSNPCGVADRRSGRQLHGSGRPNDVGATHVVAISNNRWDGRFSSAYRPRFIEIPAAAWMPVAVRCPLHWELARDTGDLPPSPRIGRLVRWQ